MAETSFGEEYPGLHKVTGRPSLPSYLRQLWERRHFIRLQSSAMTLSRHQGTLLGNIWLILKPVMDGMVYFIVFGMLLGQRGKMDNYLGFLMIGVFLFSFTARSVSQGTGVISSNRGLIRAFTFPRASLPLALISREIYGFIPVLSALFLLLMVMTQTWPTWYWLLLLPILVLQTTFNLGLAMLFGRIGFLAADLRTVVPYLVRFWFYGSAVMFPISLLDGKYPLDVIAHHNPMFLILDSSRDVLLYERIPPTSHWTQMAAWAVGALVVGFFVFWSAEESYGKQR